MTRFIVGDRVVVSELDRILVGQIRGNGATDDTQYAAHDGGQLFAAADQFGLEFRQILAVSFLVLVFTMALFLNQRKTKHSL